MTHILFITSSACGDASDANWVSVRALDEIHRFRRDAAVVVVRDLACDALPHIDEDFVTATHAVGTVPTAGQPAAPERLGALIDELLAVHLIVTAAAMMNSGVLSILTAWTDHICRAGRTFGYGEEGAKGFVSSKQVIVVVARGGIYSDANKAGDFQLPYLPSMLVFLCMTEVEVVEVEGMAFGSDAVGKSVAATFRQLHERCSQAVAADLNNGVATMDWCHREPQLSDVLSDPIIGMLMKADGVDPRELELELRTIARVLDAAVSRKVWAACLDEMTAPRGVLPLATFPRRAALSPKLPGAPFSGAGAA